MRPGRSIAVLCFAIAAALGACGGSDDDGGDNIDAASGIDAANACTVPTTTMSCTVGDDAPCMALCATAYCHNFGQLPTPVCTNPCAVGSTDQCPSGWSCNNMGRCRPP